MGLLRKIDVLKGLWIERAFLLKKRKIVLKGLKINILNGSKINMP